MVTMWGPPTGVSAVMTVTMAPVMFLNNECLHSSIVKLREREGQRVDLGRSLKGHLWMVDGGWWYTFP